jgi:type IV secretory pathway VirB10-like protein
LNSAVKSPVVAILEDNYQENGVVILPAGSRAIGRLVNADKSGYIEVHFDSLDLPSGSSLQLEAVATDLQLRPLRGRVEGKGTGKNLLLRSAAGIGQAAATLVGRGSLNQPLSEEDMLRERLSNNIGQASDQELAATALSQRFVVSLGAGAEIYLVVEKGSTEKIVLKNAPGGAVDQHSLDQLRQLLQLERELNASTAAQQ